jgi:ankyrin repeat protein
LVILSLLHILGWAYTELEAIGKELLKPLEGGRAYVRHRHKLGHILYRHNSVLQVLRGKLEDTPKAVVHIVLAATVNIAYPPRFLDDTKALEIQEHKISYWEKNAHDGIAYILHIRRLRCKRDPTNHDVQAMIDARDKLIGSIGGVIKRQHMEEDLLLDLIDTQLFVPKDLFQISAVAKAIEQDGRRDCLRRPVGHMLHDNKVSAKFRFNSHEDGYDYLGRSRIHIACALGADEQHLPCLLETLGSDWSDFEVLGLNAFHIAAINGNTYMFHAAAASGIGFAQSVNMCLSWPTRRNYFHWAACLGHLELVEYFLRLREGKPNLTMDLLACRDQWNDTAMHLAARNGHTDIVKVILPHTDWAAMTLHFQHTPFWAATAGRHLEIMKLLEPFSDVNKAEMRGLTPLEEASRQGFVEGVKYLLSLKEKMVNSINVNGFRDEETNTVVLKTPLDFALEGGHTECARILKEHGAMTRGNLLSMGSVYGRRVLAVIDFI